MRHASPSKPILAGLLCVISCLCFSAMGVFSKLTGPHISAFTNLLSMCLIMFVGSSFQVYQKGVSTLRTLRVGLHIFRDIVALSAYALFFYSLKTTPLVDAVLLNNTAPIWVPFIALFWLKVQMRKEVWWSISLGFLGVIAILKPDAGIFLSGSFFALLSGIFTAISLLAVAQLKNTESTNRIVFYYSLIGLIVTLPLGFMIPSQKELLLLLGVGLFGYMGSALLAYSFEHGKAHVLAPLVFTTVLFSGIFDWLIWNHIPDLFASLGMILVIGSSLLSIHFEQRYQKTIEHPHR